MVEKGSDAMKTIDTQKDFLNMLMVGVAVILLMLYSQVIQNKKHWIYLECAVGAVYAIASAFLGTWVGALNSESMYFFRLRAACVVSQAIATYFTEQSTDRTVPISVSISNLLIRAPLVIMLESLLLMKPLEQKDANLACCEASILFLLVIGNAYHVISSKTRIFSHRTVGDPISFHLSIDAIITFILGAFVLGFPKMFLSAITSHASSESLLLQVQLWGMMLLGGSMLSFASLCYRDDEDAICTLKAKIIVYATALLLGCTHLLIDAETCTHGHMAVMIGLMAGLTYNAGNIIYQYEKED